MEGNYNIWLIDDDPIQNKLNARTISGAMPMACEFQCYTNPLSALGTLKENAEGPDFTFIDLDMPSMKGIEYIKAAHEMGQRTPVIILSSSINGETLEFAKSCNLVQECIHKPLVRSDLSFLKSLALKDQY